VGVPRRCPRSGVRSPMVQAATGTERRGLPGSEKTKTAGGVFVAAPHKKKNAQSRNLKALCTSGECLLPARKKRRINTKTKLPCFPPNSRHAIDGRETAGAQYSYGAASRAGGGTSGGGLVRRWCRQWPKRVRCR